MLLVDESVFEPKEVVVIVLVQLGIELGTHVLAGVCGNSSRGRAYQVQDGHFHHTLVEVRCSVLDNLNGYHFLCLHVLALDNLPESALSKHIENKIAVPTTRQQLHSSAQPGKRPDILVTRFFRAQNVIDVENVITVLVIVAVILHALAGFGQDSAGISR